MILEESVVEKILATTKVAKIFGLESFIVNPHIIRGFKSDGTFAINTPCDLDIGCAGIGINRIDVLHGRLALVDENVTLDCVFDTPESYARLLHIKSKKLNVEYRFAREEGIKCHKQFNVTDFYRVELTDELKKVLAKSKNAMKSEVVTIICDNGEVSFKIADENNDKMIYQGDTIGYLTNEENASFVYNYDIKLLLLAMANTSKNYFNVATRGILHFIIDDIDAFVINKVG